MKFLTISVVASFIACLIFTAICLVLSCLGYTISDTLIQCFFTVFGVEFAATAAIKISKHTIKKQEVKEKIKNIQANNLEIDKSDLDNSSADNSFEGYSSFESYDDTTYG